MMFDNSLFEWLGLSFKKMGDGWMCYCPFHKGGSRTPPMGVTPKNGTLVYHCFACGASGTLPSLVAHVKQCSFKEAIALLEKKFYIDDYKSVKQVQELENLTAKIPAWEERGDKEVILPESVLNLYKTTDPTSYMRKRALTMKTLEECEVGYDKWKERVTIPVRNADGKLVGIVGRSVIDAVPKYLFYDNFPKAKYCYGMHEVEGDELVICEGHIDRLWLRQCGIVNAVALQGCMMSKAQADWIAKTARAVILFLDNDKAGRAGTDLAVDMLKDRIRYIYKVDYSEFPEAHDTCDFSLEGCRGMVRERQFAALRNYLSK